MDPPVDLSSLKPVRRFVPTSWKTFFHRWRRRSFPSSSLDVSSFPPSPSKEEDVVMTMDPSSPASSSPPPVYEAKEESFRRKYSYLRSYAGLLRLLSGLELLLGGLVFACVAAYVQKDDQWNQLYRSSFMPYNGFMGYGGYYGPMSPFVLAVAGLAWLLTLLLLGLGLTTYHRVILLGARWWPPTEAGLNLLMALLYLAAALAYLNGVRRGGLCYTALAYNPLLEALCRVGGGQVAALLFLFLNAGLYFAGALLGLLKGGAPAPERVNGALSSCKAFSEPCSSMQSNVSSSSSSSSSAQPEALYHKLFSNISNMEKHSVGLQQGFSAATKDAPVHYFSSSSSCSSSSSAQNTMLGFNQSPKRGAGFGIGLPSCRTHGPFSFPQLQPQPPPPLLPAAPRPLPPSEDSLLATKVTRRVEFSEEGPETLSCAIPTGRAPRPHLVPDYILKYPAITTQGDREKYKAVFMDQYAEYKELYNEVRAAQRKFRELSTLMHRLPRRSTDGKEQSRLSAVWRQYRSKKKDPAYLEKQERCHYLQRKLTHIKVQIQAFDRESGEETSVHL
ncbi:MARVEL domain-containing protein 2-like [Anolis sagrei]|uniref:MARVEL domain-containing protein 2-like n=1 Tax=Anolis sagrei TaxID=38937 RepID=UPI0035230C7A